MFSTELFVSRQAGVEEGKDSLRKYQIYIFTENAYLNAI
jgi:hypothetical protein